MGVALSTLRSAPPLSGYVLAFIIWAYYFAWTRRKQQPQQPQRSPSSPALAAADSDGSHARPGGRSVGGGVGVGPATDGATASASGESEEKEFYLIFYSVAKSSNLGTMLRSCAAFKCKKVCDAQLDASSLAPRLQTGLPRMSQVRTACQHTGPVWR